MLLNVNPLLLIIATYLIGSFPSGLVIGKLFYKTDIREHGSGNLGGTNALRVLGIKGGMVVYVLDILKGGIAIYLALNFQHAIHPLFIAVFAIIGHLYPVFAGFKGGKAVATSAGIILFYAPLTFLLLAVVFFSTLLIWKMVSLSSTLTAIVMGAMVWLNPYNNPTYYSPITRLVFTLVVLVVVIKHIPNFKRIAAGTESKIGQKKKNDT